MEFALIAPVLLTVPLVAFDIGLYSYEFISVQKAADAAALRNAAGPESAGDQQSACTIALQQMQGLPNSATLPSTCGAAPLVVTSVLCSSSTPCSGTGVSADGSAATQVSITYTTPTLFQAPFVGPTAITATAQMRLRSNQ